MEISEGMLPVLMLTLLVVVGALCYGMAIVFETIAEIKKAIKEIMKRLYGR